MPNIQTTAELLSEIHALRNALLDANGLCRSAFQVANRLATELGTHALRTSFGALADRLHESLQRQHKVILDTGGYVLAESQPTPSVPDDVIERGIVELENIRNRLDDTTLMNDRTLIERLYAAMVAAPETKPAPSAPDNWLRAIDEALVVTHLGVANADDNYEEAKRKLNELICWHADVATDPAVNGGFKLVPIEPTTDIKDGLNRSTPSPAQKENDDVATD